jgi:uncharacterized protein DUF3592
VMRAILSGMEVKFVSRWASVSVKTLTSCHFTTVTNYNRKQPNILAPMKGKRERLWALAMLPIVIGIVLFFGQIVWHMYRIRSTWPLATGTVVSAHTLTDKCKGGGTGYGVGLVINYLANGKSRTGNARTYRWTCDYEEHLEKLQRYTVGTKLMIRYDPEDFTRLVLSPDPIEALPNWAVYGIPIGGIVSGLLVVRLRRELVQRAASEAKASRLSGWISPA